MDLAQARSLFGDPKAKLSVVEGGIKLTYPRAKFGYLLVGTAGPHVLYRDQAKKGGWLSDVEEAFPDDLINTLSGEED